MPLDDQQFALRKARVLWGLTLLLVVPLPFIAATLTSTAWLAEVPEGPAKSWNQRALVIGVAMLLAGFFGRNQVYKSNWRGDAVTPEGYVRANAFFFALLGSAGLLAFGVGVWQGLPTASYQSGVVLLGLLIFNFPNGKPMQPQPPRLGEE